MPDPANPLAWNRYAYVYNNPVNYTDPSGHSATAVIGGLVALWVVTDAVWDTYDLVSSVSHCLSDSGDNMDCYMAGFQLAMLIIPGEGPADNVARRVDDVGDAASAARRVGDAEWVLPKSIPSVRNGEFARWFNSLTPEQFDQVWADTRLQRAVKSRLRHPGGLHEWHLVSRADTFKRWGVTAEQIHDMRTAIGQVEFVNPIGIHSGKGSTIAHNELLGIIDTSLDYDTFVRRLQNWSHYRLPGGVEALPLGLQP